MSTPAADRATYVIGSFDTKGAELAFIADRIRAQGVHAVTVDVSTSAAVPRGCDVSNAEVAAALGIGYVSKGTLAGRVLFPLRDESGRLYGYVGFRADREPYLKVGRLEAPS